MTEIEAAALLLRKALLRDNPPHPEGSRYRQIAAMIVSDITVGGNVKALKNRIEETFSFSEAKRKAEAGKHPMHSHGCECGDCPKTCHAASCECGECK